MKELDQILLRIGIVTMSYYPIDFTEYITHLKSIKLPIKIYIDHQNQIIRNEKAMKNYFYHIVNYGSFDGYINYNKIEIL